MRNFVTTIVKNEKLCVSNRKPIKKIRSFPKLWVLKPLVIKFKKGVEVCKVPVVFSFLATTF